MRLPLRARSACRRAAGCNRVDSSTSPSTAPAAATRVATTERWWTGPRRCSLTWCDAWASGTPLPSLVANLPNVTVGHSSTPAQSVTVSGNYANAHHDGACKRYAGVLAWGAAGVIFEANHASSCVSEKYPTAPICSAPYTTMV